MLIDYVVDYYFSYYKETSTTNPAVVPTLLRADIPTRVIPPHHLSSYVPHLGGRLAAEPFRILLTVSHNGQANERLYLSPVSFPSLPVASLRLIVYVQPRFGWLQHLRTGSLYPSQPARLAGYLLRLPSLGKPYHGGQKRLPPLLRSLKRLRWRESVGCISDTSSISAHLSPCLDCRLSRHCSVMVASRVQSLHS